MTVARKPVTGESAKETVKTIVQGKPDATGEPVVLPPCFFCTGPTGAIGTRLSLRPLNERVRKFKANLGRFQPRDREAMFAVRKPLASSLRKQAKAGTHAAAYRRDVGVRYFLQQ